MAKPQAASGGPDRARNLQREKQRRDRMNSKELRERFPQFTSLRLDFVFSDTEAQAPAAQSIVLHPPARAYFVYPCPHGGCNGELDLAANVDDIAEKGEVRTDGHVKCSGERHGRHGKAPCDLNIEYSIAVGK